MNRRKFVAGAGLAAVVTVKADAQPASTIKVFGPGGPAPAMQAAAEAFQKARSIIVDIVAGPTPIWASRVAPEADMIFSGAEYMMDDFRGQFRDLIDPATVSTLYLRPSALLVHPGNPKDYKGLSDFLGRKPTDSRLLATQGAGQVAMWEDIAGRTGDVSVVRAMRERIVTLAPNTGAAQQAWRSSSDTFDAWLVWNTWQIAAPTFADLVEIEERFRIWRSMSTAITMRGGLRPEVREFGAFLQGPEGEAIFKRFGWSR